MKSQDDVRFGEKGGSNWENATRLLGAGQALFLNPGADSQVCPLCDRSYTVHFCAFSYIGDSC